MGSVFKYPDIVHVFVKMYCEEMTDKQLAQICNNNFGTNFTTKKMSTFRYNHGYHNHRRTWHTREELLKMHYPEGMYEYIRDNSYNVPSRDMAEKVNEIFGTHFTPVSMKQFRQRYGIKSGLTGWFQKGRAPGNKGLKQSEYCSPEAIERSQQTQFKKGHRPVNELPVGSITIRKVSSHKGSPKIEYKFLKIKMDGKEWDRWILLHHKVWEDHNGPIPEDMCVCFKDGDQMNCDINNLILVRRNELSTLAKKGLWSEDPDLTETAVYMVRLQQAAKKRRKNEKRTDD